jgi:hypothetical protein
MANRIRRSAGSSNPAADGIRAAKTDRAVFAALERGDRAELANIAAVIGFEEFGVRYPAAASLVPALKVRSDAAGVLQLLSVEVLVAVRRGDIDLNALAAETLADRGLDLSGNWVGFERAKSAAKLSPVRRGDGSVVFVSVPESEGK